MALRWFMLNLFPPKEMSIYSSGTYMLGVKKYMIIFEGIKKYLIVTFEKQQVTNVHIDQIEDTLTEVVHLVIDQ